MRKHLIAKSAKEIIPAEYSHLFGKVEKKKKFKPKKKQRVIKTHVYTIYKDEDMNQSEVVSDQGFDNFGNLAKMRTIERVNSLDNKPKKDYFENQHKLQILSSRVAKNLDGTIVERDDEYQESSRAHSSYQQSLVQQQLSNARVTSE